MTEPKLVFSREEFAARLEATRRAMVERGLDLAIVTDPSNMNWLTGYDGWSFYVHQAVIIPLSGEPIWFGRGMDAPAAWRRCWMKHENVIGYPDHYVQSTERHPMDYLSAQLTDRGLAKGRVGVEMDNYWFTAAAFASLQANMPNAKFEDLRGLVNWRRAVKSPAELALMRKAGALVTKMHARIADLMEPGLRKSDLVAEIYDSGIRFDPALGHGGDYPAIAPLLLRLRCGGLSSDMG